MPLIGIARMLFQFSCDSRGGALGLPPNFTDRQVDDVLNHVEIKIAWGSGDRFQSGL